MYFVKIHQKTRCFTGMRRNIPLLRSSLKQLPTKKDMAVLMSHINSTKRGKHNGKSPFELASGPEFEKLKQVLGIEGIPADDIVLDPRLLHRQEF